MRLYTLIQQRTKYTKNGSWSQSLEKLFNVIIMSLKKSQKNLIETISRWSLKNTDELDKDKHYTFNIKIIIVQSKCHSPLSGQMLTMKKYISREMPEKSSGHSDILVTLNKPMKSAIIKTALGNCTGSW